MLVVPSMFSKFSKHLLLFSHFCFDLNELNLLVDLAGLSWAGDTLRDEPAVVIFVEIDDLLGD